jgi:hypothetical protein
MVSNQDIEPVQFYEESMTNAIGGSQPVAAQRSRLPTVTDPPALGVDAQGHHTTNHREQNIG